MKKYVAMNLPPIFLSYSLSSSSTNWAASGLVSATVNAPGWAASAGRRFRRFTNGCCSCPDSATDRLSCPAWLAVFSNPYVVTHALSVSTTQRRLPRSNHIAPPISTPLSTSCVYCTCTKPGSDVSIVYDSLTTFMRSSYQVEPGLTRISRAQGVLPVPPLVGPVVGGNNASNCAW